MTRLSIFIPKLNAEEIAYVIQVIFMENIGIQYDIEYHQPNEVIVQFGKKRIFLNNFFFSNTSTNIYVKENLPKGLQLITFKDYEISCLYGSNQFVTEGNDVKIGGDIIGSTFFLITQWESCLEGNKDDLGRFSLPKSTLGKLDIYKRPVIDEYVAFLEVLLVEWGIDIKKRTYEPIFTCDVDSITKYSSIRNLIGAYRHLPISKWVWVTKTYFASRNNKIADPYYSFDYLNEIITKHKMDFVYYFMADKKHDLDMTDYSLLDKELVNIHSQLKKENIGIHFTFDSSTRKDFVDEADKMKKILDREIIHARQHYLKYDITSTWRKYQESGVMYSSNIQFSEGVGFAAGTCRPFSLFDIVNRKVLNVQEIPLLIMVKKDYGKKSNLQMEGINAVINFTKKYNGKFMILVHNSNVEVEQEKKLVENILDELILN
jgi:hypothetical protein